MEAGEIELTLLHQGAAHRSAPTTPAIDNGHKKSAVFDSALRLVFQEVNPDDRLSGHSSSIDYGLDVVNDSIVKV